MLLPPTKFMSMSVIPYYAHHAMLLFSHNATVMCIIIPGAGWARLKRSQCSFFRRTVVVKHVLETFDNYFRQVK